MTVRALVSYHYHRDTDLAALVSTLGGDVDLFADSGAYTAHNAGNAINLADYAAWLRHWSSLLTVQSNLDVIGDHMATAANLHRLQEAGCRPLPVFHANEPWPVLERLCAQRPYVALGGLAGTAAAGCRHDTQARLMRWLVKAFRVAADHGTAVHGFGFTSSKLVRDLPFYSLDSSSYSFGQRIGLVYLWDHRALRIRRCFFRNHQYLSRRRDLLAAHGALAARLADPGFMRAGTASVADDRATVSTVSARAFQRMEESLRRRHRVPAPPLPAHTDTGTKVYLAIPGSAPADLAPLRALAAA